MSVSTYQNHELTLTGLYHVIGIVPDTIVYGVYSCLVPVFIFVMLTKGLQTRVQKALFSMTLFMYSISTIHWSFSVASVISIYKPDFLPSSPDISGYLPLLNAIVLVNYFLTDGVVVWRAWVLCSDQSRGILKIPVAILFCLATTITVSIALRIRLTILPLSPELNARLFQALDDIQVATLVFSLLTNIFATTIISMKAWSFRRDTQGFAYKLKKGNKIMAMLVESGILYCLSGITALLASLIRLEKGTLGDIYLPVSFQIAGIYPIAVILLVNQGNSMDNTFFMSTIPCH